MLRLRSAGLPAVAGLQPGILPLTCGVMLLRLALTKEGSLDLRFLKYGVVFRSAELQLGILFLM
jgi:hypothetical protein